jgi:phosphoribosylpyrophosphate synthetase
MDIKYLNLLNNTFYNTYLIGGASSTSSSNNSSSSKYILLSCPEFNETVNKIITLDSKNTDIISRTENDLQSTSMTTTNDDYERFLEDIGHNLDDMLDKENKKIEDSNKVSAATTQLKNRKTSDSITALKNNEDNKKLYARSKSNIETEHYYRGFIHWEKYGDKTPDIKMNADTVKKLKGGKVIFFAYFTFNEENATPIMNQLLFLNSLNHYGVAEINIVLPYFPVGTMERIVGEGETPTGYALAQMINSIPSGSSKNTIYIFDIHALCSRFFFHTNTIPVLVTLMPKYLKYIENKFPESGSEEVVNLRSRGDQSSSEIKNLNIIVFPDDGAKKRFAKLLNKDTKTITCSKVRVGNERKIKIDEGIEHLLELNSDGKPMLEVDKDNKPTLKRNMYINLFIIDDLVQSGGTLIKTVEQIELSLKLEYITKPGTEVKFYTLVTHSILPTKKEGKIELFQKENIQQLITSDSRPLKIKEIQTELGEQKQDKLHVIPIADICHEIFTNGENKSRYIAPYSIN